MNPRYILFIHMVLNDMLQLTVSVLLFILCYVFFSINVCVCCLLVTLAALTTQNTPLNLVCMAMECFIAVFLPLRRAELCTIRRTYTLIGLIWLVSSAAIIPDVLITLATEPLSTSSHGCSACEITSSPNSSRKSTYTTLCSLCWCGSSCSTSM